MRRTSPGDRGRATWMHALHDERVEPATRRQVTRPVRCGDLPDGAMVRQDGTVGLISRRRFLPWAATGYGRPRPLPDHAELLTPSASVAVLRAGYSAALHPSAEAGWSARTPTGSRWSWPGVGWIEGAAADAIGRRAGTAR